MNLKEYFLWLVIMNERIPRNSNLLMILSLSMTESVVSRGHIGPQWKNVYHFEGVSF